MALPARIRQKRKEEKRWRSTAHCDFVRSHACCACGSRAAIEVAHVRRGSDAGMGRKPSDFWAISLCHECHAAQHRMGEQSFEELHNIDMRALAEEFAAASPKAGEIKLHQRRAALAYV